jgi:hypothetical protein
LVGRKGLKVPAFGFYFKTRGGEGEWLVAGNNPFCEITKLKTVIAYFSMFRAV